MSAQNLKCKKCGTENSPTYKFCGTCGTPLFTPQPQPAQRPPEPDNYKRGLELLREASSGGDESKSQQLARQAAAEFALAVKKANGKHPDAHAGLGLCHLGLGDRKRAFDEFNLATSQEPLNLTASMGRLVLNSQDIVCGFLPNR